MKIKKEIKEQIKEQLRLKLIEENKKQINEEIIKYGEWKKLYFEGMEHDFSNIYEISRLTGNVRYKDT